MKLLFFSLWKTLQSMMSLMKIKKSKFSEENHRKNVSFNNMLNSLIALSHGIINKIVYDKVLN